MVERRNTEGGTSDRELLAIIREAEQQQSESLDLSDRNISQLPDEIGGLANLKGLDLDNNQLTALPESIAHLANLQTLNLNNNQLTALPESIAHLANLQWLDLVNNQLTALPESIAHLANLQWLDLDNNQLTALPESIAQLANLQTLFLGRNRLTTLPESIAQLANLQVLDLDNNQQTTLPESIAHLANLQTLYLARNQLRTLPNSLAALDKLEDIDLDDNPLNPALQSAYDSGLDALKSYLRSLEAPGGVELLYEAKLVLVGEGDVGKTTLLKALTGREPREGEPTTHGANVDIQSLRLPHPVGDGVEITFNAWDFGGQDVYRVTHQFFFSPHAVYLLVWEPRLGVQACQVEDWLRLIRLRVGSDARVIIVSTHCCTGGRIAQIDRPVFQRDFGDMIVDFLEVDSLVDDDATGDKVGVAELKSVIAGVAKDLPQMGTPFNQNWRQARDELVSLEHPRIPYEDFSSLCLERGLDDVAANTLARQMHDLGYTVYYGDDERLENDVVLQPAWLTKAIGFVLEDRRT